MLSYVYVGVMLLAQQTLMSKNAFHSCITLPRNLVSVEFFSEVAIYK